MPKMELSEGDLATAYGSILMGIGQRESKGAERYFEEEYDVDIDELIGFFTSAAQLKEGKNKIKIDKAVEVALVFYELGRRHQQLLEEMPLLADPKNVGDN